VLSDVVQLPHRLRQQGLWGLEPDIFIADLASLGLDPADRAQPPRGDWEADALSQFARLMRDIRNYGVHPRQVTDRGIGVYFTEDKCGLLFLEAGRHLKHLAEVTAQAIPVG
jgi:hypothetical protein